MGLAALALAVAAEAQNPASPDAGNVAPQASSSPAPTQNSASASTPSVQGGTIHGTVVAGTPGKPGGIPLPGVAITATNTLTGKKYTTSTDIDGAYAMKIPRNGRYVVRAELAGFAATTQETVLTGMEAEAAEKAITIVQKPTDFGLQLASRAEAAEARQEAAASASSLGTGARGASLARGVQSLSLSAGEQGTIDASAATGNAGIGAEEAPPSLAGLGDSGTDSITVSGQQGQTNSLANYSEDEIRQRVQDAVEQARANGQLPPGGDPTNAIVGMLGGMMGGGGGGRGSGGGGGRGGRGGGGGGGGFGSGAFRNFNPAQPHGSIFYQGSNSSLNSAPWSPSLQPLTNPSAYSNRFGLTIAGSPYIPKLTKPNTKQFVFINLTGQKNLNAFLATGRVPTALERGGDFSQSTLGSGNNATPVELFDPTTGAPIPGNNLTHTSLPISPVAQQLLNYYPAPNISDNAQGYNYQTISNAGSNNVAINTRYIRNIGNAPSGFGRGGGGGRRGGNLNAPPALRQNVNISYNYSHSAQDNRNIFLALGGASETDGNALNAGYTVGYGRLSNNASLNWNRLDSKIRNYFTDTANNPSATVGLNIPNQAGGFADPRFYNGLPNFSISNFQTLSNATPSQTINQTISFSDFVSYRHKKHNMRYGLDIRRVHADSIGGNNPLGLYTFTGYATASPADQQAGTAGQANASGNGFADFLLGLPESTSLQAGLYKIYLRENAYDAYGQDDYRVSANVTINAGLRYEYFAPYTEKNNRLVNLDHDATFSAASIHPVQPGAPGFPSSLVNPDRTMFSPRFGIAWKPRFIKDTVVRGGYGINYNTGQFATFATSLSHQVPFANTQTNDVPTPTTTNPNPAPTGCTTLTPSTPNPTLTLANGFGCSTAETLQNNWAVDKNYRLGMVQVYNLNIQRIFPLGIVFNLGYSGSKGSKLDVVGSPNGTPSGTTTPGIAPFDFEEAAAESRSNSLIVSAQKRQQKGIALGFTYTYSHTIDNASGVGGAVGTPVQNFYRLDLEEGNASFDQRHNLSGNWLLELPFGPNRAFFNKGGLSSKLLDGFSLSGMFTFATGSYFTPTYQGNQAEAASGNTFTQRPDRVFGQPLKGLGAVQEFFNKAAFTAPASGQYGSASQGSIEGPGTVSVNATLSRTVQLGGTNSFEARVTASNVFNTVQYSGINTTENSANFGEVTSAAAMRSVLVQARYRF